MQVRSNAVVVALHLLGSIRPASDQSDGHVATKLHGKTAVVLQKNDTFLSGAQSELLGLLSVDVVPAKAAVSAVRAIEVTKTHERGVLADEGHVEVGLVDQALLMGTREVSRIVGSAVVISTGSQSFRDDLLTGVVVTVGVIDILNRAAVADNSLLLISPVPVLAEDIVQEPRVRASWAAVESIVGAHEAERVRVSGALLEGRHIVLHEVPGANLGIELVTVVTVPRLEVVSGKVLAGGAHTLDLGVLSTLKTVDEGLHVAAQVEGVFTGGLLSTSPSRVSEGVDVGLDMSVSF